MKISVLVFILFGMVQPAMAQLKDSQLIKVIDSLKFINTDTFLVYTYKCYLCSTPSKDCEEADRIFLFWVKNGNTSIARYDMCETYNIFKIDSANPIAYYIQIKEVIGKEELMPPTYAIIYENDSANMTENLSTSCFHNIYLITGKDTVVQIVDDYFITQELSFEGKYKNIYLEENQQTKTFQLIQLIKLSALIFED